MLLSDKKNMLKFGCGLASGYGLFWTVGYSGVSESHTGCCKQCSVGRRRFNTKMALL